MLKKILHFLGIFVVGKPISVSNGDPVLYVSNGENAITFVLSSENTGFQGLRKNAIAFSPFDTK